jgi:hypothetical protein
VFLNGLSATGAKWWWSGVDAVVLDVVYCGLEVVDEGKRGPPGVVP